MMIPDNATVKLSVGANMESDEGKELHIHFADGQGFSIPMTARQCDKLRWSLMSFTDKIAGVGILAFCLVSFVCDVIMIIRLVR